MLAVRIEYLMRSSFAASHLDREVAEWPPHPSRLFSALVDAAYGTDAGESAQQALRWLQDQEPPLVLAPKVEAERSTGTSYVPVNDKRALLPALQRNRQPRRFPAQALPIHRPVVYLRWASEPSAADLAVLSDLCREVPRLGHSASVVRAEVVHDVPDLGDLGWEVLKPDVRGDEALRVPYPGRLEVLQTSFLAGRRPLPGRVALYRRRSLEKTEPTPAVHEVVAVFRLESTGETRSFPSASRAVHVAERIRSAWMALHRGEIPAAIHGHGGAHVALVPLARVGHPRLDGRILGCAVLAPSGLHPGALSSAQRASVFESLPKLNDVSIFARGDAAWTLRPVQLLDEEPLPEAMDPELWAGTSRWWATVSPVVLDRFPRRSLTPERIVAEMVQSAGLPGPVQVRISRFSPFAAVPPAYTFKTHGEGPRRPVFHVGLAFPSGVAGPLLLGQQRHFGLGFFRPLRDPRWLDRETE